MRFTQAEDELSGRRVINLGLPLHQTLGGPPKEFA